MPDGAWPILDIVPPKIPPQFPGVSSRPARMLQTWLQQLEWFLATRKNVPEHLFCRTSSARFLPRQLAPSSQIGKKELRLSVFTSTHVHHFSCECFWFASVLRRRKFFKRRVIYDVKDVFICFGVCVWGFWWGWFLGALVCMRN